MCECVRGSCNCDVKPLHCSGLVAMPVVRSLTRAKPDLQMQKVCPMFSFVVEYAGQAAQGPLASLYVSTGHNEHDVMLPLTTACM